MLVDISYQYNNIVTWETEDRNTFLNQEFLSHAKNIYDSCKMSKEFYHHPENYYKH